ncbi:MAG: MFS transporter [Candidatus Marinimicrobia bacterium]|jgi:phosphoglycerate transporter family protein|nr:MFS transporter [Candidatus Neomarinimicrobiota bacterium]MBT4361726.1 MFS transporter [Candidatus Neomarinimicrobiota bacterium]MBT4715882.1 MFS transporter [Candidatus Neomarinimicrobiota bacterium]MBT4947777.1 MFS transporter [Candidatus Neomarinimicrobiota bacterium]MBT5271264.1 MFS transporter [Candidatus Neomarinimicrobiota bacterium]
MKLKFLKIFDAAPPVEPLDTDTEEYRKTYRYYRIRIMYTTMIGYALFYFVRKNMSLALPGMEAELGITKAQLGLFLTLHGLLYGLSKLFNGILGDRANPRYFMAAGLALSALMNILFGMSSTVLAFGLFWMLNGYFQGMGFPPCARSITHWFSASERGTKFAIWNTSHSIGASLVLVLTSFLVVYDWRLAFYVPAGIALFGSFFLAWWLRDTPESLGLPAVEVYRNEIADSEPAHQVKWREQKQYLIKYVVKNPMIWVLAFANFFLYTIRFAILDWGPSFLIEMKGVDITQAGWIVAGYEVFGIAGMLVSGWLMDRVFKGRGGRAAFFYMLACTIAIYLFWRLPSDSPYVYASLLSAIGFFIYGPQALVGTMAANLATKKVAAAAIGLTGLFGYLSGILSGWGLGAIVDSRGWSQGYLILIFAGLAGTILFALTWNAVGPHIKKNRVYAK